MRAWRDQQSGKDEAACRHGVVAPAATQRHELDAEGEYSLVGGTGCHCLDGRGGSSTSSNLRSIGHRTGGFGSTRPSSADAISAISGWFAATFMTSS